MIHSSLYSSHWLIFYKMSEEKNIELMGKWVGKKRYECYDRNVYKERAMSRLKCDVLNGVYQIFSHLGNIYVSRQRGIRGASNIIAYELKLFINQYFNYDKDRTLLKCIKSYVMQILCKYWAAFFVREIMVMEIQ